ncbi:hypothetical protein FGRA07_10223 [Fusarium graminearum]|nr:hypothetical protein FGRA07_10223 [Fusarium graminearum]
MSPMTPIPSRQTTSHNELDTMDEHLTNLPMGVILKALNIFTAKFPELRILQASSFIKEYQTVRTKEGKALLATTLAITRKQCSIVTGDWLRGLRGSESYATYAWSTLSDAILQPPKVQVVQALLILTLYEWGVREYHKAWMHCGMAIRIMQSLHSSRITPHPLDVSQNSDTDAMAIAVESRTYWACFIMDCTINSGTYNPRMLPMSEMHKLKVPRPLNYTDFAFGFDATSLNYSAGDLSGLAQGFESIALGFDIYAQAMSFVFNNGRCAPGMCAAENCPWVPSSSWYQCRSRLEEWRKSQHERLWYPQHSVVVHMTLGHGESFIYLNMLYYLTTIMLHREYFPFLPIGDMTPRGPVDPPLLEAEAPPGWWDQSARELFSASEQIACLLQEASECGIPLMTPFSGFCAFTACFLNLYVFRYPRMNLGRSTKAEQLMNWGLEYLEEFQNAWELAGGWIKTIQNSSLLYKRATEDEGRYRGRSRADFEALHQSIHEYRIVDRSDQHLQQISHADRNSSRREDGNDVPVPTQNQSMSAAVSASVSVPDPFPNWWSMLQEVEFTDVGNLWNGLREIALLDQRTIKLSTYGIIFMGTPHQGGNGVQLGRILVNAASVFVPADDGLLKHLERDSEWLLQQLGQYGPISGDFATKFAYEKYKTPIALGKKIMVMPRASAVVLGQADAEPIAIHANHKNMVKFTSKQDVGYITILETLQIMMKDTEVSIRARWEAERRVENARANATQFSLGFSLSEVNNVHHFVARDEDLAQLQQILTTSHERRTVVIHALGGIGKTQLAIAFAKQNYKSFSAVFWMNATDKETLKQSFTRAADRILRERSPLAYLEGAIANDDTDEIVKDVGRWLSESGNNQWLVIFDNYNHPSFGDNVGRQHSQHDNSIISKDYDIRPFFPKTHQGAIIITTRSATVKLGKTMQLSKLRRIKDSLKISESTSNRLQLVKDPAAIHLTQELDGLPLALATAGAYLDQVAISYAEYLELYKDSWGRLQESSPQLLSYEDRAMYSTWNISFQNVKKQNKSSAMLLKL